MLHRDFQAMIDWGGPGERIGRRLLRLTDRLFEVWNQSRDIALRDSAFQDRILRLRLRVHRTMKDGTNVARRHRAAPPEAIASGGRAAGGIASGTGDDASDAPPCGRPLPYRLSGDPLTESWSSC